MTETRPEMLLHAITRRERHAVTTEAMDLIAALGGWVDDARMFSNTMTTIRFHLAESRLEDLRSRLCEGGLPTTIAGGELRRSPSADRERAGSLQITFVHDEGDLRHEVPSVPG